MEQVPGARMIQYHGQLADLPRNLSHLPVIGFVRNPWDWYVSMFFDYRRKKQYVFQNICDGKELDFETTVSRFLKLGDSSEQSRKLLDRLVLVAPTSINAQTPPRRRNAGLRSDHFRNYPDNIGYCSWLFQRMYESKHSHRIHIGRFENLTDEVLRLFEITGTPITNAISAYLDESRPLNISKRPCIYSERYSPDLQQLVADKEKYLIEKFGYTFSTETYPSKYPKADYYRDLGTADVSALVQRIKNIPETFWDEDNKTKLNKFGKLNETRHIMFRFVNELKYVFDFEEYPRWDEWKDSLLPLMEQAAQRLGYKNYRFPRAMLARLPAGGEISPHVDLNASHYIHKIHVPLITNPETEFHVGNQARNLTVGEITEVNNKRMHAVYNKGQQDRVHFIFECYNADDYGRIN